MTHLVYTVYVYEAFHTISQSLKHHHLRMIWNFDTCTSTCCKNILKFQVPYPPGSQIMAFLSFPYFGLFVFLQSRDYDKIRIFSSSLWHFSVLFFNFLVRFHKSGFRIWSQNSFDIVLTVNFCILPHCRTHFSFNFKWLMQKSFFSEFLWNLPKYFIETVINIWKNWGGLFDFHFYTTSCKICMFWVLPPPV